MRLKITHQTNYYYDHMTLKSVQYIRMTPKSMPHQEVEKWQVLLPCIGYFQSDGFGNQWTIMTRNEAHNNLQIQAHGIINIDSQTNYLLPDRIPVQVYLLETPLTKACNGLVDFTQQHLGKTNGAMTLSHLKDFAAATLDKMPYTPGATASRTTASEALEKQLGVCQDHTHVFVSALRYMGIPARYVSGYLYTDNTNHLQTHAWAEGFIDNQWHTFDVSNQLFTPSAHVYVAFGRDYDDAAPVRGIRQGGGTETMTSQVLVEKLEK